MTLVRKKTGGFPWLAMPALLAGLTVGQVQAAAVVTVMSGGSVDSVVDQDANDLDPTLGSVVRVGALGDWNVNASTGISKPVLGSSSSPLVDLNSINISSLGASESITITFWDYDFSGGAGTQFRTAMGGTLNNADISWGACIDIDNGNNCTTSLTSGFSDVVGSFSENDLGLADLDDAYSIGLFATIEGLNPGQSVSASFDFEVSQVPVPAAAWLFGTGLLGLAGAARRKAQKARS